MALAAKIVGSPKMARFNEFNKCMEIIWDPVRINRSHSHPMGFPFPFSLPGSFKYNSHTHGNPIPKQTSRTHTSGRTVITADYCRQYSIRHIIT